MSLSPNYLLASMFLSGVGFVLFSYGRKQRRLPHGAIGFVMMVYPYFVSNVAVMLGLAPLCLLLLWLAVRLGL